MGKKKFSHDRVFYPIFFRNESGIVKNIQTMSGTAVTRARTPAGEIETTRKSAARIATTLTVSITLEVGETIVVIVGEIVKFATADTASSGTIDATGTTAETTAIWNQAMQGQLRPDAIGIETEITGITATETETLGPTIDLPGKRDRLIR